MFIQLNMSRIELYVLNVLQQKLCVVKKKVSVRNGAVKRDNIDLVIEI